MMFLGELQSKERECSHINISDNPCNIYDTGVECSRVTDRKKKEKK